MLAACPYPAPLGTAVCIHGLAQALGEAGHAVHVVSYANGKARCDAALGSRHPGCAYTHHQAQHPPVPLRSGPNMTKLWANGALYACALQLARQRRFDFMHGHHVEGILLAATLQKRLAVPVVGHIHTSLGQELPTYLKPGLTAYLAGWVGYVADTLMPKLPNAIVTLNRADAQRSAVARQSQKDIYVCYPSVDHKQIKFVQRAAQKTAELDSGPWVVYSGNADRYQNLSLLAAAMFHLQKSGHPCRLLIATHGPITDFLHLTWPKTTRLRQVTDFFEMCRLLRAADVGVCSRQQCSGFPIKWLNYWHCGLPLVALQPVGRSVYGAELGTDVHGPATWTDANARCFARAIVETLRQNAGSRKFVARRQNMAILYEKVHRAAHANYTQKHVRQADAPSNATPVFI